MKCKNHPSRNADKFCTSCSIPICDDCAEEVNPGEYFCFNCAMLQTVSSVGSSLSNRADKRTVVREKKRDRKKIVWGPFHYFVVVSCVLISVMWVVILFGGEKAPGRKADYTNERVLIFKVDSSIRRYYHYEDKTYPDKLDDLIPKYLRMAREDRHHLGRLVYVKDSSGRYSLSPANPKPGSISTSSDGIKFNTRDEEVDNESE